MLIVNAEINGTHAALRVRSGRIHEIGALEPESAEMVVDARYGAVLPGLHDHHLHFFALLAARNSVDCRVPDLGAALRAAPGRGWIRGWRYHESISGDLSRQDLDLLCGDRPVRLQHASGKMWLLNSAACEEVGLDLCLEPGVERDLQGKATGRLFRMDDWLARVLPVSQQHESHVLARELHSYGLTGFTDASYTNSEQDLERFLMLPFRVQLMGSEKLRAGHLKIMLDEDNLPDADELVTRIEKAHSGNRPVAFHSVSRLECVYATYALETAGSFQGDRLEHGGILPDEVLPVLKNLGVTVVTQPGFLADRGDRFVQDTPDSDVGLLYRYQSLREAGISVAASSDAPYGPVNPWEVMQAAVDRRSETGQLVSATESVTPAEALRGYLSQPSDPGGPERMLNEESVADIVILDRPLDQALSTLGEVAVRHTILDEHAQEVLSAL